MSEETKKTVPVATENMDSIVIDDGAVEVAIQNQFARSATTRKDCVISMLSARKFAGALSARRPSMKLRTIRSSWKSTGIRTQCGTRSLANAIIRKCWSNAFR